ncbi:hypothetical protein FA13DRAFT_1815814 [Coprinellus micaceus]|uniref:F-box domain-containing protein n=1 Tax=Coprinellus micaceus TaxID=71717 RepID=A0A4Y7T2W1_COPMI|nr:hypothetical protein FA13DRAFT_1815814 [Coprinellus micaceus]
MELARFLAEGPALESLSLECEWPECFQGLSALIPTAKTRDLRAWDQLKSLHLECPGQGWTDNEPNLFQLLTQLLESLSEKMPDAPYEWSDLLPSLPMLQHLSTLEVHEYVSVHLNDPPVDFDEGPFEGEVCALPNMKVFRLHATDYLSETNATPSGDVAQLALQSNDLIHLKTLLLTDMFISARGLNAIFKALPSITHLTLKSLEVHDLPVGPVIENGSLPQLNLPIRTVPGSLEGFLTFLQFRARSPRAIAAGDSMDIAVSPVRKARIVISREHDGPSPEHEMGAQTLWQLGVDFSLVFP